MARRRNAKANKADKVIPKNYRSEMIKVPVEKTSALECFEVIRHEYELECNKSHSFESRAAIIITILAALCIFIFEKIHISQLLEIAASSTISFMQLIKICAGTFIYLGFALTLFFVVRTIRVEIHHVLDVSKFNEAFIGKPRLEGMTRLIFSYRAIILQHREVNERKAKNLKNAMIWLIVSITAIAVYVNC